MSDLIVNEHKSTSYAPRTYHNASQGVTLAVAVDFNTAGEKLTHKAAKDKVVQIPWGLDSVLAARQLYSMLKKHNCSVVNVAGNGIYTLQKKGVTQEAANQYIYDVLELVNRYWPITQIVSGGQTGMDIAGLVAGCALDIETIGMWPKGLIMRFEDGKDVSMTDEKIKTMVYYGVKELDIGTITKEN
jgi:hypothetical protein